MEKSRKEIFLNRLKYKNALIKTTESFLDCKLNSIELLLLEKDFKKLSDKFR